MSLNTGPVLCWILAIIICGAVPSKATERNWSKFPMEKGHFDQSWESLTSYEVPEWFRDAKLGIWAIIGPQCVPMQGDWYARHMYIEGHRQYQHHVKRYGHPSNFGYKDLIQLFNPEKLDFDHLLGLYKQAGAKYAVLLAVHHDNFDLWNSKHHEWNSVQKGPKRDLVGEFRTATLKHKLRFGVTTHLARTYSWLQTSHGADKQGPMAGVPYDGADPQYQSLYHPPFSESARYPQNPPESWELAWYLRVKDLIDSYQPDLMYFDGGYPFDDGAVGRRLVAHYYNANTRWRQGSNEAAMCIKKWAVGTEHGVFQDGTCVRDIERGKTKEIAKEAWQTDTCIGGWYYRTGTQYKTVPDVIRMLIDIVSKNGNLLLNIPLRPNGTIDAEEEEILAGMGQWMRINGEGLYGTRPWVIFGEGPSLKKQAQANHFGGIRDVEQFIPGDLRFVTKGVNTLHVFLMAYPEKGRITIESLAPKFLGKAKIESVIMLGMDQALRFEQSSKGLVVKLPQTPPCHHAWTLRIQGQHFDQINAAALKQHAARDDQTKTAKAPVTVRAEGAAIILRADQAGIHGESPRLEKKAHQTMQNLGYWSSADDWVFWDLEIKEAGWYDVSVTSSAAGEGSRFVVGAADQSITVKAPTTQAWDKFTSYKIGQLYFGKAGVFQLSFKPAGADTWRALGVLSLELRKAT
jgi:alpha-L-fucosidase